MSEENYRLLYFTDPMCSWCYGFAPEVEKIRDHFAGRYPIDVIPGGLRAGETQPMPERMSTEVSHHWHKVHEASGLPFNFSFFEGHPGFVYNTEPGCRAINTAVMMDRSVGLDYLHRLQKVFYAEGDDPTDVVTFLAVAKQLGLDSNEFENVFHDAETARQTRNHFQHAKLAGITGYPAMILSNGERMLWVSAGYQKAEILIPVVDRQSKAMESAG